MHKIESGAFIPLGELQREPVTIEDLDQLQAYLVKRSLHFSWTLQRLHRNLVKNAQDDSGWHTVFDTPEGKRKSRGRNLQKKGEEIFTGENLCFVASFAAKEALEDMAPHMQFHVVQFETDMNAEAWGTMHTGKPEKHNALLAVYGDEKRLIDFTFGQINHTFAGEVVMTPVSDAWKYYRNPTGRLTFVEMTIAKYDFLQLGDIHLGLRERDYNRLVQSLK